MTTESQQFKYLESEEISLKSFILKVGEWKRFILSKWLIILIFGLFGGILGFSYAFLKKSIYTATTTFVLEDEKSGVGLGNLAGLASIAGVDLGSSGGGIFQGDNILELYKSRRMIQKTLLTEVIKDGKKKLLIDEFIEFKKWRKDWKNSTKQPGLFEINFIPSKNGFSRMQDSVLREATKAMNEEHLSVSKIDKKLSIIKVELKAKDEFFANVFNTEIVKNVNDFYIQTKTKKSIDNIGILQHKTDSVRKVMSGAIYGAISISDATPNLNPTRQIQRAAPMQRSQFTAETNKAILSEMVKNLELAKMALLRETPLIQVIDQPNLPLPEQHISKLIGLTIGGILGVFITVLVLMLKEIFNKIVAK